jgi:hypothetical protein
LKEIHTEIDIKASSEIIWDILTDFDNYSQWNPFIRQINGAPTVGTKLKINIKTTKGKSRNYHPTVTKVEPYHELRWFGKSIIPGMFNGERIFALESLKANYVHLVHKEIFTGFLVSLIGNSLDRDMYQSFVNMNEALKEKAEQTSI